MNRKLAAVKPPKNEIAEGMQLAAANIRRDVRVVLEKTDGLLATLQNGQVRDLDHHNKALRQLHQSLERADQTIKDFYARFVMVNGAHSRGRWANLVARVKNFFARRKG